MPIAADVVDDDSYDGSVAVWLVTTATYKSIVKHGRIKRLVDVILISFRLALRPPFSLVIEAVCGWRRRRSRIVAAILSLCCPRGRNSICRWKYAANRKSIS